MLVKLIQLKHDIIRKIGQTFADALIDALRMTKTTQEKESVIFYALLLDNYMIETHNIYLN